MWTGSHRRRWQRPLCVAVLLTSAVASGEPPVVRDASYAPVRFAEVRCPVTGEQAKAEHRTRLRGRRVYCATDAARVAFQKDPYAYQDGLQKQWKLLQPLRVQLTCPVSGKPIRRDVYVERQWDELYFASEQARQRWSRKPDAFAGNLARIYSFQTTCGTCPNPPKGGVSQKTPSGPIYFCCTGCQAAFATNAPAFLKEVDVERKANRKAWEQAHGPRAPNRP